MRYLFLALGLLGLTACDQPQSYAEPPAAETPASKSKSGVSVSGYARVGVSHTF
jgi:hypothetical protein